MIDGKQHGWLRFPLKARIPFELLLIMVSPTWCALLTLVNFLVFGHLFCFSAFFVNLPFVTGFSPNYELKKVEENFYLPPDIV